MTERKAAWSDIPSGVSGMNGTYTPKILRIGSMLYDMVITRTANAAHPTARSIRCVRSLRSAWIREFPIARTTPRSRASGRWRKKLSGPSSPAARAIWIPIAVIVRSTAPRISWRVRTSSAISNAPTT